MSKKNLNKQEIIAIAHAVAKPTFNYMRKKMEKELSKINSDGKVNMDDMVNIVIIALSSIDVNMLKTTRTIYESAAKHEMDFVLLVHSYLHHVMEVLNEEEIKKLKEKMN
jgi:type II secretory pathway component GspD/PulD (secretin)